MKLPILSAARLSLPLASALAALLAAPAARATDLYWDIDDATAGAGGVAGARRQAWNSRHAPRSS